MLKAISEIIGIETGDRNMPIALSFNGEASLPVLKALSAS